MASKLSAKELKVRDFILSVFRKEAPATKATLTKLLQYHSDPANADIFSSYGGRLYSSFLSMYRFKSLKDYQSIIKMFKESEYYNSGESIYATFHDIITKKLFDSDSVKTEWIIDSMASSKGSLFEINTVIRYVMSRHNTDLDEQLKYIIDEVKYSSKGTLVCSVIARMILTSNAKLKDLTVLDDMFSEINDTESVKTIEIYYANSTQKNKKILNKFREFLYQKTKKEKYLSKDVKEIFVF